MINKNKFYYCCIIFNLLFFIIFNHCTYANTSNPIFSTPNLNSKSAIILEKSTGTVLFGKNENDIKKMASTTKIMTAIVVLENTSDLSEIVVVSKKAASIGGSRLGLSFNSQITVKDLLYGLLLCSGNDSAIALAEFISDNVENFANLMNQKALALGLSNTHFVTPHGLDNENHYTTAYELALLTKYALENKIFSEIVSTHSYSVAINGNTKIINNTNELLGYLNGVYGVKTGFTNGANRCLVTACKRGDLDIICIVLGADTKNFRTQDSIKLIEYAFTNFEMIDINSIIQKDFSKWQSVSNFSVNKGVSNHIQTTLEVFPFSKYPVNKTDIDNITTNISCSYNFEAPLSSQTLIGTLDCYINNLKIRSLNIFSTNTISKKSPLFYLNYFVRDYSIHLETIFSSR